MDTVLYSSRMIFCLLNVASLLSNDTRVRPGKKNFLVPISGDPFFEAIIKKIGSESEESEAAKKNLSVGG